VRGRRHHLQVGVGLDRRLSRTALRAYRQRCFDCSNDLRYQHRGRGTGH
jgi:hypothetical protein